MDKPKEELINELHYLHKEYDLLKTSYSKEISGHKQTEEKLLECEYNLKERIKELHGIYSLGNLVEKFNKLEDISHAFVNTIVPESLQFPEKAYVSLEIERKKYKNIENFNLLEGQKNLSAPIKMYGKQAGELIVAYTEDLPFFDFYEQNLIHIYAERISKIAERLKTQQILEENEAKYRNLIDNLGEGIGIVDINEEFLFVNSVAESIFGVGKGELVGRNLKEFFSEEEYLNILHQSKIRKKALSSYYETELTLRDGEKRQIQVTAVPNLDIDGEYIGTYGVFKDITERKKDEKALQESEEKLRSILENSADAIFITNQQGKYLYTNKAASIMLGYTSEELNSKFFTDISPPNKVEEYVEYFKKILTEGSVFAEIELLRKDGNNISTDLNAVLLPDGMIYASCRNITERKQAEHDLKESERKLIQLNADKDRFISILGHDLKNPFNNLLGLSEILKADLHKLDIDEIEILTNQINKTVRSTYKLLEDILMWARTQQGKFPFKPQTLMISDICINILEALNPNAKAKNIAINCLTEEHISVFADVDMLKTILRNLVSNAIKFTNRGGAINLFAIQKESGITVTVSDNGIGIKPDNLAKLFDITQVISTKGTAKETGTGLGLLLCKEFVEKHRGKIWVESEVGRGSDFIFTLPFNS